MPPKNVIFEANTKSSTFLETTSIILACVLLLRQKKRNFQKTVISPRTAEFRVHECAKYRRKKAGAYILNFTESQKSPLIFVQLYLSGVELNSTIAWQNTVCLEWSCKLYWSCRIRSFQNGRVNPTSLVEQGEFRMVM